MNAYSLVLVVCGEIVKPPFKFLVVPMRRIEAIQVLISDDQYTAELLFDFGHHSQVNISSNLPGLDIHQIEMGGPFDITSKWVNHALTVMKSQSPGRQ